MKTTITLAIIIVITILSYLKLQERETAKDYIKSLTPAPSCKINPPLCSI